VSFNRPFALISMFVFKFLNLVNHLLAHHESRAMKSQDLLAQ
jgi:hypothetical protein